MCMQGHYAGRHVGGPHDSPSLCCGAWRSPAGMRGQVQSPALRGGSGKRPEACARMWPQAVQHAACTTRSSCGLTTQHRAAHSAPQPYPPVHHQRLCDFEEGKKAKAGHPLSWCCPSRENRCAAAALLLSVKRPGELAAALCMCMCAGKHAKGAWAQAGQQLS